MTTRTPPRFLYRYRAVNKDTLQSLADNRFWFSSPLNFNDPFDCRFDAVFQGTDDERRHWCKRTAASRGDASLADELMRGFTAPDGEYNEFYDARRFAEERIGPLGILCLSERRDHLLMWAFYAKDHSGVCLEFETLPREGLFPVTYSSTFPLLNALQAADPDVMRDQGLACVTTKSPDWAVECEWRLIKNSSGLHHVPEACLAGVILGSRISEEDERAVRTALAKRTIRPKVYRAREKPRSNELEFIEAP